MKLLLFGGTFDPPHMGHMENLKAAISAVGPGCVVVMPAGLPPHKAASETPAALRLAMCECFRPLFSGLEVSDREIRRGGRSFTIDTLEELHGSAPGTELYLCIGSDMLLQFGQWRRWQDILAMATLVVQNRSEEDVPKTQAEAARLKAQHGAKILFAPGVITPVSSTQLRAGLALGQPAALAMVPPPADEIIRARGLYGYTAPQHSLTPEEAKQLAKKTLSPKRYAHVKNVAKAAKRLAQRYGVPQQKAALAAWLHDIVKERPRAELLQMLDRDAIMAGSTAQRPYPIWHGPCAAIYARHELGVADTEVLDALGCHTTGRPGMTQLDKVLYLADMISEERTYPGADDIRAAAQKDLDTAVEIALARSIQFQKDEGKELDEESVKALEYLRAYKETGTP